MDLENVPVPNEQYCIREVGEETIFLSEEGEEVHWIDAVGTSIWRGIDGSRSLSDLVSRLCEEYEVESAVAEKDLVQFMDKLAEKGLVTFREGAA